MMNNDKKIIAFAGRQRSGKTYMAKLLEKERGAKVFTIASYLKQLCCKLINVDFDKLNELKNNRTELNIIPNALEWSEIIYECTGIPSLKVYSEIKEVSVIKDVRELLQVIGTNVIRKYYPDWHIDQLINEVNESDAEVIAIDDVRFPNEYKAIDEIGGKIFFIIRTTEVTNDMISNHQSETALKWTDFPNDRIILNINGLPHLRKFIEEYDNNFTKTDKDILFLSSHFEQYAKNNPLVFEDLKCRVK